MDRAVRLLLSAAALTVPVVFISGVGCFPEVEAGYGAEGGSAGAGAGGASGGTAGWQWTGGTAGKAGAGGAPGGGGSTGGTGPCLPTKDPPGVPPGWEAFTGYSCGCRVWVPGPAAAPPEPVKWEACPSPWTGGSVCKRMLTEWSNSGIAVTIFPRFWHDTTANKSYLQFGRIFVGGDKNVAYRVVADADGPIMTAFFQPNATLQGCAILDRGLGGGRYAFGAMGEGGAGPIAPVEGIIGGVIGETTPSVILKQPTFPELFADWSVTSEWVIESKAGVRVRPWDLTKVVTVYDPSKDAENLPSHGPFGVGGAVFTEVGAGSFWGVMSWTTKDGLRPLLRAFGDGTQGYGNFMTDGVDMVWTHGHGKAAPGGEPTYPLYDVWTAPFTTDPTVVAATAKRLRSDLGPLLPYPYRVGCGYAARSVTVPPSGGPASSNTLLVVRLSDGVSWIVAVPPVSSGAGINQPIGLTCDEIFAVAQFPDEASTIIRIRLDSLGPGMAPD